MLAETIISAANSKRIGFLSRDPTTEEMQRLVVNANSADIEIVWPAAPSLMRKSLDIGVSKLTGMNSDATRPKAVSDIAITALQARFSEIDFTVLFTMILRRA